MAIQRFHVAGYRSIKDLALDLGPVNVLVGPNGSGKSNLFRALTLLHAAASGRLARTLADESGMPSVLWAGPRAKGSVRMTLGIKLDLLEYELACSLPKPAQSAFSLDPLVKEERLWFHGNGKRSLLLERDNQLVKARDADGHRVCMALSISESESVLSELRQPEQFPVLFALREDIRSWRSYSRFRTDPDSPIRQPQIGVRTPVLADDGRDLAAALQTILEIGDHKRLHEVIDNAFPGSELRIDFPQGRFQVALHMPGFQRPFTAQELSDGTLQYLCLAAALLSPRPSSLLALNEPEASIHPSLLPAVADLIAGAGESSQLWITTHSQQLASLVADHSGDPPLQLRNIDGQTRLAEGEDKT
jgi:predicted ATPase